MTKIKNLLESKAFIQGILAAAAAAGAVFGFNVPVATIMLILTPLMVAIGAQGWNEVTQTRTRMQHDHEMRMAMLSSGNAASAAEALFPAAVTRIKQAGFVRTWLLMGIVAVGAALIALSACKANCKAPANVKNAACIIQNAVVNCTGITTPTAAVDVVTADVKNIIDSATDASGKITWSGVEQPLLQLVWKYGVCIVAQVWNGFFPANPSTQLAADSPYRLKAVVDLSVVNEARATFEKVKAKVAAGYTFRTAGGDL